VLLWGLGLALLLLADSPLVGQGKPAGKDKGKGKKGAPTVSYYPLEVGNSWEYLVTRRIGKKVEKHKATVRVVREETVEKVRVAVLETTYDGGKPLTERLAANKDGLFRYSGDNVDYKPPLCLLKLPPEKGQDWDVKSQGDGLKIKGKFRTSAVGEFVTVPAGEFEAVASSSNDFRVDKVKMSITYWFVPNVGLVKQRVVIDQREVLIELEKYTLAK
jgi:hypothetical protein